MEWYFISDSGELRQDLTAKALEFSAFDLLGYKGSKVGFIANDNCIGRSCLAKIAGVLELPIVYGNNLPNSPACLVLKHALPEILPGHSVWFIAGRGLGSKNEFNCLAELAQQCYADVGATRALVDCGWAKSEQQIGQGGLRPTADFAISIGVSGAVQHIEGLGNFKCLIAVNPDINAEIFRVADYGIVASWQEFKLILPGLFNKNYKGDCYVDWGPKRNQGS